MSEETIQRWEKEHGRLWDETTANEVLRVAFTRIGSRYVAYRKFADVKDEVSANGVDKALAEVASSAMWTSYYDSIREVVEAAKFLGKVEAAKAIAKEIKDCPCNAIRAAIDRLIPPVQAQDK